VREPFFCEGLFFDINHKETIMATAQKQFHNQATEFGEEAKDLACDVANRAKEAGSTLAQKAGDVVDKAKEAGATLAQKAGEATSFVGKKADDATAAVGAGMKSVASTIREKGPGNGVLGSAGSAVADTLDQGGRYLQEKGLSGIGHDMTEVIRRNPIPAVLVGIGLGYLMARALTPRA
jgi:hypothetical protein